MKKVIISTLILGAFLQGCDVKMYATPLSTGNTEVDCNILAKQSNQIVNAIWGSGVTDIVTRDNEYKIFLMLSIDLESANLEKECKNVSNYIDRMKKVGQTGILSINYNGTIIDIGDIEKCTYKEIKQIYKLKARENNENKVNN